MEWGGKERESKRCPGERGRRKERKGGRRTGNATQASPQTAVVAKVRMNKSYETMELEQHLFSSINKMTFHYHSPTG